MTSDQRDVREVVRRRILDFLTAHIGPALSDEDVDETTQLRGQGLGEDSLDTMNLVCAIEEEFGMTIEDGELEVEHLETVGSLVSFVEERLVR